MCPFCLTTLGAIVASAASTGGVTKIILSGKKHGATETVAPRNAEVANQKVKDSQGRH
jgi:hypothetical protein